MQNCDTFVVLNDIATYYSTKLVEYGATPRGVDWNSDASQQLRFEQLSKIIKASEGFTLNDIGCGYGALYEYLRERWNNFEYTGIDISSSMITAAKHRHSDTFRTQFILASTPPLVADYGVASGIFNVRLAHTNHEWRDYLKSSLDIMNQTSRVGFSFNCLTTYSDPGKMRNDLYYANPNEIFDYCKLKYSRNIALLHDYDLYEFTILVRK